MIIHRDTGYIEIIIGSMFSGKTSSLVNIYEKTKYCNIKTMVINHAFDTRYSETKLSTHDKKMIPCIFIKNLYDVNNNSSYKKKLDESEVILINEGQFFDDLYDWVKDTCEKMNKQIYVCGLDGDFKREKFGKMLDLIPICDKVTKLQAYCSHCKNGTKGIFTHRLSNETEQCSIGVENYESLCRKCFLMKNNEKIMKNKI